MARAPTPPLDDPAGEAAALAALVSTVERSEEIAALRLRIDRAVERWPTRLRFRLIRADLLDRSGQTDAADVELATLGDLAPHDAAVDHKRIMRLLGSGRRAEAVDLFATRVWSNPAREEAAVMRLLNQVTAAHKDMAERVAFLERLPRGGARDRFVDVKRATIALREHDRAGAMALLDRAAKFGPLPPEGRVIRADLLLVNGRFDEAADLAAALVEEFPDRPDIVRKAIQTADLTGRSEAVAALLAHAMKRWPEDWLTLFRYNRAALPFALDRATYDRLTAIAAEIGEGRWHFQLAIAALRHGDLTRASAILEAIDPAHPVAQMALPLRDALRSRPVARWNNPRAVSNDPEHDVQVRRHDDARATCVVFAGVQGGLGYLPFSLADTVFADYPVNMVYLRDRTNLGFNNGVAGLGVGEEAMIAGIARILDELGGMPLVTAGSSLGGLAATRAGTMASAAAVLSFAAPIHFRPGADDKPRFRAEALGNLIGTGEDLLDRVRAASAMRVYHCYGTGHPADVAIAEAIADLGNVVLIPVPCEDHFPLQHMLASGAFGALMTRMLSELAG
ncbi:tetratricopeptide repeat protein [Sphingomonas sp. ID0503]|uniref:tetratricopeptide repeat protein n=1 Tax=Sphingomonas sp. ID0503 TaxID=3399691 RepID=UPI003AFA912C